MRRLLWMLLVVLGIVLAFLVLQHNDAALAELTRLDGAGVQTKVIALALLLMLALLLYRGRFPHALASVLIWAAIVVLLMLGYTYRFELHDVADRVLAEFIPGHAAGRGRTVAISRAAGGSFAVTTQVNGVRVAMVLDTGASAVVLTHEAARAAGLPLEVLSYSIGVDTANGRTRAAPVTLDRVSIGGITERAVAALIAQPGQLRMSLLGMSFLNRLERWEVRGDKLVLRAYP